MKQDLIDLFLSRKRRGREVCAGDLVLIDKKLLHIVATVKKEVWCVICLRTGNRWIDPIHVVGQNTKLYIEQFEWIVKGCDSYELID